MTFCKLFLSPQVYDGITNMSIICNDVVDEGEWINLWEKNRLVASFDKSTILGWILMGEQADTPQTDCGWK